MKNLLYIFLLIICNNKTFAQNFPVTSTPIVQGGSDMRWSSFYSSSEKIKLQLVLKDKDRPSLEVFLKLKIERAGIVIRTRQDLMPPQVSPITLSFGSAKLLNGPQMLEYFRPENLEVEGLDPAFLTQGGTLPDGLYSVSVTAYEYDAARGHRQVSNTGYGFFAVYLGLPPIIQAPKDGAELPEMAVQNIMFQWLPRTAALPGGDGTQAYQFELFEVGPGEDAQQVANGSLTKVFTTTTSQPYLLYNPALANAPPLKPGGQYAIRVQVVSTDPSSQSYQNKGYSQVVSFSYGTPCLPPTGISMALSNYLYDKISWLPQTGATGYTVQYKTEDATEWQSQELFSNFFENYNPKQAKIYQYKVMSRCSENRTSEAVNTSRSLSVKPSCQPPTDIVVTQTDQPNTVKLSWAAVTGAKDYTIHVKKGMLQALDEYTTGKTSLDITYTSKSFNANIRTNCSNGSSSSYISASEYIPTLQQAKLASQAAFLKSAQPNVASGNPVDILNPFDIVVNSEGITDEQVEAEIERIKDPNEAIQTPCGAVKITDTNCDPVANTYSGTVPFAPSLGKFMYINGYEILITSPSEGLLYLPLIKSRVPVEWSGLTVKKGPTSADYGCITAGQVQMQGSQSGVISGDLFRQVMALLTQGPGSFSGKFGEALDAAKKLADELLAKIATGTPLTPDEITKYKGVCKAVNEGINAYKAEIEVQIPAPRGAEVDQILADLQTAKMQFQELVDCNSLGYNNRFDTEKTERFEYQKGPFANFTSLACNLSQGKTEAVKVIESVEKLTLMLKPSPNETYSQRNYSCLNGTKAILTFNPGITNSVTEGIDPPVWTLNNSQYYLYWKADASGIVGFYAKNEVDLLKSSGVTISSVILEKVPKFTSYIVSSIEPNSSDCKKKSSDFDPNSMGDYFTDAGLNRLKDKLAQQGASNTEITVKDCTDPTKVPKTVTSSSISASKGQNSIQIEMCWNGTKWVSTILKYEPATSYAQARGMTKISEAAQAAKDAAKNALDNNQGIDAFSKQSTSADGFTHEFKVGSADALESAVYFLETGKYLIENLQVPPESWQGGGPTKKVLSIPPVLGGGTDQGLAEVKDLKQMVDLGVAFVKEPASTLGGIWDGITGMTWEDAMSALTGDWQQRIENYEKGNPYDWYQGGRDGVVVVKSASGLAAIKDGLENATSKIAAKLPTSRMKKALTNAKLVAAGLKKEDLVKMVSLVDKDATIKKILSKDGDAIEEFMSHLDEIGKLDPAKGTNFGLVISGLKTDFPPTMYGQIFRLRACKELGWANVDALEKTVGTGGSRYMDIVTKTGKYIETKYYATFANKTTESINGYLTQIQKDITSGNDFEHWLSKTGTITAEAQLHAEIKDILTNKAKGYSNGWFDILKSQNGWSDSDIDDFIFNKFKFKDFNQ
ncbi:hypothetical protein MCERE19_01624 [Spirosomataceae bacterium]